MDFQDKIDMKNDHEYAQRKMAGRGDLYSGFEGTYSAVYIIMSPHRLVREGGDDLAEGGEALVDIRALLEPRPLGPRGLGPLRARQVHQGDAAHLLGGEAAVGVVLVLGEDDGEDGVAAAAALVHVGGGHGARLVALVHQVVDVGVLGHGQLAQVLHVGAEQGVLAHAQVALGVGVQQVPHALTVNLHVAHLDVNILSVILS